MLGVRDSDIFSKVPFHGPLNGNELFLMILNLAVALYRLLDYEEYGFKVFLIASAVLYLTFLLRRAHKLSYFNQKTERVSQLLTNFLLWFALAKLMQQYTVEWKTQIPLFFIAFSLIVLLVAVEALKRTLQTRLLFKPLIFLKSEQEVEQHVIQLIQCLENFEEPECRVQLEGYLGAHLFNCKLPPDQCMCSDLKDLRQRSQKNAK